VWVNKCIFWQIGGSWWYVSYEISSSLILGSSQSQNGEAHFVGITGHELLAHLGRILDEGLLRSRSMLNREGFAPVQLVQSALLVHQGDKVMDHRLVLGGIGLTLLGQSLMVGGEFLVGLQGLATLLRRKRGCLLQEALQYTAVNVNSGDTKVFWILEKVINNNKRIKNAITKVVYINYV